MSRSVVADRLCPRIDNMQIENSVDNKENVFQCNGKLGHKMKPTKALGEFKLLKPSGPGKRHVQVNVN